MTVTQVSYETIKNLGNYENEKVALVATVQPGEDPQDVLAELQKEALKFLHISPDDKVHKPGV